MKSKLEGRRRVSQYEKQARKSAFPNDIDVAHGIG